jgi:replicative DNA helicase
VKGRILFVSFEMDTQKLINRLACIRSRVNYGKFNKGLFDTQEMARMTTALDDIKKSAAKGHEIIFAGPAINKSGRRRKGFSILDIEQMARDNNVCAIFIDGLLHATDVRTGKKSRDWNVISNLSSDTKLMALGLGVPVLATHQANREGEKETPVDSQRDMAYADALGQDTDMSLRVTKIRGPNDSRQLLLQPTGAREFELLGFTCSAAFCEGLDGQIAELVTKHRRLADLLKKEAYDDVPGARVPQSLGAAAKSGHKKAEEE